MSETLIKKCVFCHEEFTVKNAKSYRNRMYCSVKCRIAAKPHEGKPVNKQRVELTCLACGNKFLVKASRANKAHYCSVECYNKKRGMPGETNPAWNGGMVLDVHGYLLKKVEKDYPGANCKGYIRNCRYVWQETTGEILKATDVIHHINGIRSDDKIENLQKYASHSEHIRIAHNGKTARGEAAV